MINNKPIVGISGSVYKDANGRFPGYRLSFVNEDYVTSVENEGGVPFIIPVTTNKQVISNQVDQIDGLVLSGGVDVNPLSYDEEPLQNQGAILPERDEFEIELVRATIDAGKPVFAICRGMHILNIAYGGTLYQDIEYISEPAIKHEQESSPWVESHTVHMEEGSYLHELFGEKVLTNSFHHQVVKDVAPDFTVTARADDGVIEGMEKKGDRSVFAVQWHPEMMTTKHENMRKLFNDFVERVASNLKVVK